MQAAQQGNRARYSELLAAAIQPLRRAARARWPHADASALEDAVQETLLALHTSLHLYDPARPFLPFLYGIMRFRGGDAMRRSRRAGGRQIPIDDVPENSDALLTNSDQHKGLEAGALLAAISSLPNGQRRAIEMTKMQELSLEEASTTSGMSVAALKVATHRGIQTLRKLLNGSV